MNIYQLEYFVAIVEEGTMQKAATRLFVSQPALSAAITGLEKELGHYLFHRSNKGMRLTDYGTKVYPQAKAALDAVGGIRAITDEEDAHASIRVLFMPALSMRVIPRMAARFHGLYPGAMVQMDEWSTPSPEAAKRSVKDFTFVFAYDWAIEAGLSKKDRLTKTELVKTRRVAVVSRNSSLAERRTLSKEDFAGRSVFLQYLDEGIFRNALSNVSLNIMTGMGMGNYLASNPDAIGVLPCLFGVNDFANAATPPLVMRPIDFLNETFTLYACHDANRPISAPETAFLRLAQEECAEAERVAEAMLDET